MVAVNVRPVFVGVQAASRHMEEGSRIIVIGSVTADRTGFSGSSVYSMTKAAVAVLASGLAIDLAPRRITVNIIHRRSHFFQRHWRLKDWYSQTILLTKRHRSTSRTSGV
jgi:NAD(P)-dependent dehydrogenase (short-subunit alcohol dehydrogenase family)